METFWQKGGEIKANLNKAKQMATKFQQLIIEHISREEHYKVDVLVRLLSRHTLRSQNTSR